MTTHITLKTGGDPRTLPDYAALRDELGKLTHPARPDVNWQYVEKLCLSLFEQNGVELQTAAWYTLARTHLSGLPEVLTPVQQDALAQRGTIPSTFITDTQQQLARLDKLPPDWNISYSLQLLAQLQTLQPEEAKSLTVQWKQKFNAAALPVDSMNSWYLGMMKLQQLSHRLSSLDEQKGKYITVRELKSVVFSTIQSFNHAIPAEEQLRRLSQYPAGSALPEAEKTQLELHLKQLATRYAQIKQDASAQ